jgi:hypothetical protein
MAGFQFSNAIMRCTFLFSFSLFLLTLTPPPSRCRIRKGDGGMSRTVRRRRGRKEKERNWGGEEGSVCNENGNDECTMCFHRFGRFSATTLSFPAPFFSDHRPTLSRPPNRIVSPIATWPSTYYWPTYIHAPSHLATVPIHRPSISYQSFRRKGS